MKKIYYFGFVGVLSFGLLVSSSYASSSMGKSGAITFSNQELIGAMVEDSHGKPLGVISRVLTEQTDNAKFVLVARRTHDQYGWHRTIIPVPIADLRISETKYGAYALVNGTEKELDTAMFDSAMLGKPNYDAYVYKFYGVQPRWAENGRTASNWRDYSMRSVD